jgi:hypothetical protein
MKYHRMWSVGSGGSSAVRIVRVAIRFAVASAVAVVAVMTPPELAWSAPETRITQPLDASAERIVDLDFPATHAVVQWTGDPLASLQIRHAGAGNDEWSPWQLARVNEETESVQSSGVQLVDDARRVQVRVADGQATDLKVVAIDTLNGPRHLEAVDRQPQAHALDGATPQPKIISRKEWGANEGIRKGTPEFAPVKRIAIHHTDTSNADPNPAATVRAIYAFHVQGNGWNDIGYNFLIDQQGNVYEGRYARNYNGAAPTGENEDRKHVIGAHVTNNNTGSVGISLLGSFESVAPSAAQQTALEKMIAWEGDRHDLDTTSANVVMGHRDLGQSACPGGVAWALLPKWRQNATAIKYSYAKPGATPGYWVASTDGRVVPYGIAKDYGSMAGKQLNAPIISMARTPSGKGYWLLGKDGGIFAYGDAGFYGSMGGKPLNAPVVALTPTPSGKGYWEVASDGGIFAFGDAQFYGSMGGKPLNKPVVGIASTPTGKGYWEVATDGGIFAFGDAPFYGSTGSMSLNQPIVSMATPKTGTGYWLTARDGGIFAYGSAGFYGSVPVLKLNSYAGTVQSVATASGRGYYILGADGGIYAFGDARFLGAPTGTMQAAGIALLPE